MNDSAISPEQTEQAMFSDEVSDQALENAACAGPYTPYTLGFCHPTDRCTAPAMPPLRG